jgi:hypothetical protein
MPWVLKINSLDMGQDGLKAIKVFCLTWCIFRNLMDLPCQDRSRCNYVPPEPESRRV